MSSTAQRENGRVVVVTGASKGIGRAIAQQFADRGDRVVLVARSAAELEQATEEISATGGVARWWAGDLTSSEANDALMEFVGKEVGEPDVVVMSAGLGHWNLVVDTDDEQWRQTMSLNVDAIFYATRAVLPGMIDRERGHLVYISSVLAGRGAANFSAYGASKAAVTAFADSVAKESRRSGIKTTVIYPGSTLTGMRDHHHATGRPATPDITDPDLQLTVDDVADAVLWATSVSRTGYPTQVHLEPKGYHGPA